MMMSGGMMNVGMVLYMLFMIILFGLLIYGVLSLIMKFFNKDTASPTSLEGQDESLKILKERYAKGELTETEFEEK
ncbi:SHOCT domain-containing protein [Halalkalibacter urbisdiaboli]|uniref:SHOCT domain-containing protein n=1 Tax=Halalkalibacter urbisdiaboli TaxID=1960589 RepID=UPI000B42E50F|nr:SHOCT domain-containing protein [Halalkalibacter urbisdiaboli]